MTSRILWSLVGAVPLLLVAGGCRKDACERGEDHCDLLTECIATPDGYVCSACPSGWEDVFGDGTRCLDFDQCALGTDNCAPEVTCSNEAGGFSCGACPTGYLDTNQDGTLCTDIDECAAGTDDCDLLAGCVNVIGSFFCGTCPDGYEDIHGDGTLCTDLDECVLEIDNCDPAVTCTDVDGGFECGLCPQGYQDLYGDGSMCADEDECTLELDDCDPVAQCVNTPGAFYCGPCPPDYHDPNGDGTLCEPICSDDLRQPFEGCDDGNLDNGDGCSDECLVEGTSLAVFSGTGAGQYYPIFLTVSDSGVVYVGKSTGGGPMLIHSVAPDGTLTEDIFATEISYGADGVALGEDLYLGGSSQGWGTAVQKWSPTGGLTTLYHEVITYYGGFAAADTSTFYLGDNDEILTVTGPDSSTVYRTFYGQHITYDPVGDRLLAVKAGNNLYEDNKVDDFEPLYTFSLGEPGIPAIAGEGYLYVPCRYNTGPPYDPEYSPCPGGSVWVIAPDGSEAAPIVDAFAEVHRVAWDPATDELVLYANANLYRVPLDP
ncbi:MAG: hypothetical protein JRI25_18295 [Deltaproteobacteria bacterium]|nr:hypothetical protein [Deltaproteobacteria bacterium]MBW2256528.1 hypothetical protein [Deltaproteobacteria bacterium]